MRVDAGKRLIKQEQVDVHGHQNGQGHALLLAARHGRDLLVQQLADLGKVRGPLEPRFILPAAQAQVFQAEDDLFPRRGHRELLAGILEHHGLAETTQVNLALGDLAAVFGVEAGHNLQ